MTGKPQAGGDHHVRYHTSYCCGRNPVNWLLYPAKQKGLGMTTLDLCNSGDTAGSRDRVVGYGAYVLTGDSG